MANVNANVNRMDMSERIERIVLSSARTKWPSEIQYLQTSEHSKHGRVMHVQSGV